MGKEVSALREVELMAPVRVTTVCRLAATRDMFSTIQCRGGSAFLLTRSGGSGGAVWCRRSAEVDRDIRGERAGAGSQVVIPVGVSSSAGQVARRAAHGRAGAAGSLDVQAIGLEGAFGRGAVDVGSVVPDPLGAQGVLELSDGRSNAVVLGELDGDTSNAGRLIALAVDAGLLVEGDHVARSIRADRPEVDIVRAEVVNVRLLCEHRGSRKSDRGEGLKSGNHVDDGEAKVDRQVGRDRKAFQIREWIAVGSRSEA